MTPTAEQQAFHAKLAELTARAHSRTIALAQ